MYSEGMMQVGAVTRTCWFSICNYGRGGDARIRHGFKKDKEFEFLAEIRHRVNYDFPTHIEDYVHRSGRTGRAGASGT